MRTNLWRLQTSTQRMREAATTVMKITTSQMSLEDKSCCIPPNYLVLKVALAVGGLVFSSIHLFGRYLIQFCTSLVIHRVFNSKSKIPIPQVTVFCTLNFEEAYNRYQVTCCLRMFPMDVNLPFFCTSKLRRSIQ